MAPKLPPKWYQFLVSMFASLGSVLYGYDLGVIAGAVDSENFQSTFQPSGSEQGAVVALFTAGAFFGAGAAGPVADKFGRRWTLLSGSVIFLLGGGLQAGAMSLPYMYAGRAIAGFGVGFLIMIIPPYQSEMVHPSIRGRVTALQQFMLGIGSLVAAWVSWACYTQIPANDSNQWRISLGIQNIPAGILALLIMLFPESPRWLIANNRAEYGLQTLARLHAHGDVTDPWVRAEYEAIQDAITFEREHEAKSYAELFTNRSSFRRLFLACAIQASIQMTGVSAIQYYSPDIYRQIGIPGGDTLKYQAISSIIALIAQALCILLIDRLGRRWVLIGGNLGNLVTFIIATILLAVFPPGQSSTAAGWGFIVITWIYNAIFSFACGPLSWIIPAEIFDTRTRAKGVSMATMTSMAFNTLIGQITPIAIENEGWRFYILFVVCNLTNAIFFYLFLPETAKRPLEEMNDLFTRAPLLVFRMNRAEWAHHDIDDRVADAEKKGSISSHKDEV